MPWKLNIPKKYFLLRTKWERADLTRVLNLRKNNSIQHFTILCKSRSSFYHKNCMYVTWCVSITAFLNIPKIWNWGSSETIVMKSCVPGYVFLLPCKLVSSNKWEYLLGIPVFGYHRLCFKIYFSLKHRMNNITDDLRIYFPQIDDLMNESERRYKDANKDACSFMIKKIKVSINTYSLIQYSIKSNNVFVDRNYNFPNLDEFNKSMQDLF